MASSSGQHLGAYRNLTDKFVRFRDQARRSSGFGEAGTRHCWSSVVQRPGYGSKFGRDEGVSLLLGAHTSRRIHQRISLVSKCVV